MTRKSSRKFLAALAASCLLAMCLGLAACGGGSGSSSAASASASTSASASESASASASASAAANPTDRFVGSWQLAAAESQGLTMAGNFAQLAGMGDEGMLVINVGGTGEITLGDDKASFNWAQSSDDAIDITVTSDTELTIQQAVPITYKDDALFMAIEQDGRSANAIFTKDGTYAGAKELSMADAKPITNESDLLGTWQMVGMNMMGISIYGDAEALSTMSGGTDMSITFEPGGALKLSGQEGTWAIGADGATATSSDITGTHTYPIKMLDDGSIVADMSDVMQGQGELFAVYKK